MSYARYYRLSLLLKKLLIVSVEIRDFVLLGICLLVELLKDKDVPVQVKAAVVAVLGYFIFPFDLIPDLLPGGYVDDIAAVAAVLSGNEQHINREIKERARRRASRFGGEGDRAGSGGGSDIPKEAAA